MADIYKPMFEQFSNRKNTTAQGLQQAEQNLNNAQTLYEQHQEDYITGKRNPIADLIRKPERDEDKERRLKEVAKWSAIGDAIGLMGKGWAASQGVRSQSTEGNNTYRALGELDKLDELYRQDGYRYDQMQLSEALRRQQSADNLAQFRFSNAHQEAAYAREQDALAARNLDVMAQQQADREYKSQLLKEGREYDEKRDDKNFGRQVELHNMSNDSNGNKGEFEPPVKNISLVIKNPQTGKFEPMVDGDFTTYLSAAIKENPKLQEKELYDKNTNEYNTNAKMIVIDYLSRKGIETKAAQRTLTREQMRILSPNSSDLDIDNWARANGVTIKD